MNFGSLEGEELRGGSPRREEYEARLAEWEAGRTSVREPLDGDQKSAAAAAAPVPAVSSCWNGKSMTCSP